MARASLRIVVKNGLIVLPFANLLTTPLSFVIRGSVGFGSFLFLIFSGGNYGSII
jgi:hypothetical protein